MAIKKLMSENYPTTAFHITMNEAVLAFSSMGKDVCLYLKDPTDEEIQKIENFEDVSNIRFIGDQKLFSILKESFQDWLTFKKVLFIQTPVKAIYFSDSSKLRLLKEDLQNVKALKNVLIVDDSKTIQKLLSKIIEKSELLNLVGIAGCPSEAKEIIEQEPIDLITLDIHMPEMTGVEFLKTYLEKKNIPTVMISSVSINEGPLVMEALSNGAYSYIQKPTVEVLSKMSSEILEKLEVIAKAGPIKKGISSISKSFKFDDNSGYICIGSSTGGTQALQKLFAGFPDKIPATLVVQHIPEVFSKALADRLNSLSPFTVKEAENGEFLKPNTIYVAPGGKQMKALERGDQIKIDINDDAPVNRFKPSVDYLFHSLSKLREKPKVGVILTGMGRDGAEGLLELKRQGSFTFAQDEESSVVYGMPKEAFEIGATEKVVPLDDMAGNIILEYNRQIKNQAA